MQHTDGHKRTEFIQKWIFKIPQNIRTFYVENKISMDLYIYMYFFFIYLFIFFWGGGSVPGQVDLSVQ